MKKIIITEDDNGLVEVEEYYKGPYVFDDWKLLETEKDIQAHGGITKFTSLFHHGMRQIKIKHIKSKKEKK